MTLMTCIANKLTIYKSGVIGTTKFIESNELTDDETKQLFEMTCKDKR